MLEEMDKLLISFYLVDSDSSFVKVFDEVFKVGILGSGDFVCFLVICLVGFGFKVVVGSCNFKCIVRLFFLVV